MGQLSMFEEAAATTCAFCRIVGGEEEGHIVFEDDSCVAFLDRHPLFPGHCLLVPRQHFETFVDLPTRLLAPLFLNAQLLSRAVEQALRAEGTFVAINNRVSQSVPHVHVHVVPRRKGDNLRGFFWPRQKYPDARTAAEIQESIRSALAQLHLVAVEV